MAKLKICPVCDSFHTRNGTCCCLDCGVKRALETAKQLKEKKGPFYEKWKIAMKRAGGYRKGVK